jgi:Anti-sigma factor NepR
VRRTTPRQRELRAIMRAAIAEELRELYRFQKDEPLPERFTDLLRQLDSRKDTASPDDTTSKPKGAVN